jgi:C1A family cysteine protease
LTKRAYGWIRGHHDGRDRLFAPRSRGILPDEVDLRAEMPAVYDQGQQGSCVENGCSAIAWNVIARIQEPWSPSRSHLYYEARARRGWQLTDSGSYVRDCLKVMAQEGVLPESEFPYEDSVFDRAPSDAIEAVALRMRIAPYAAITQSPPDIMRALADGNPIVFGCTVYESFESDAVAAGEPVPMPGPLESPVGGHCMVIVGYDRLKALVLVRNSWGSEWGLYGHCWMPMDYVCSKELSADLFVATGVLT